MLKFECDVWTYFWSVHYHIFEYGTIWNNLQNLWFFEFETIAKLLKLLL
jgi:hypothetical protein